MKLSKIFAASALLIFLAGTRAFPAEKERINIGVMGFYSSVKTVSPSEAQSVTDAFIHMLANSDAFTVIERSQLDALIREQRLSESGLVSSQTAVRTGKLAGCKYMLEGNITKRRNIIITAKIINVSSGAVELSLSESASSSELSALLEAGSRLGGRIREQLAGEYAYVVSSLNGDIVINRGNTALVQPGNFYRIYTEWQELYEPESGDMLLSGNEIHMEDIAVVQVVEVMERFSTAKIIGNGGDPGLVRRGDKAAPITKSEAGNLISMKKFASLRHDNMKRVTDFKVREAEAGDSGRMVELGRMYWKGFGVKQDLKKAFEWFTKAAELKNSNAYMNLGYMYLNGVYVKQDAQKGLEWYHKAEEETHYPGYQFALAQVYILGLGGVTPDYEKAFHFALMSAEQGDSEGQNLAGMMYTKGIGTEQNYAKALECYMKAAEQGHAAAMSNIAAMYLKGYGVEKDDRKAFEWELKAAELGDSGAQNNIASMYINGVGVERDYKKAIEYLSEAAEEDFPAALNGLGYIYFRGLGTKKDYKKALGYFERAVALGNFDASNQIGVMYEYGLGAGKDLEKAKKLYQLAISRGFDKATPYYNLGHLYNTEGNYSEALKYYRVAAEGNVAEAFFDMANMYGSGRGVSEDKRTAFEYFVKAAELGHPIAQNNAGACYVKGEGTEKDYRKAEEYFRKSLAQDENNSITRINLGYTYELQGDIQHAHECYRKAALNITVEEINMFRRWVSEGNNRSPKSFLKYYDEVFSKK